MSGRPRLLSDDALLDAAAKVLRREGARTTRDAIAREAGRSEALLFASERSLKKPPRCSLRRSGLACACPKSMRDGHPRIGTPQTVALVVLAVCALASAPAAARSFPLGVDKFEVFERDSGPQSYYWIIEEPGESFIRAIYKPQLQTVTLFADVGDGLRTGVDKIRFRWRAWVMPIAGNECVPGRGDGVANVYIAWKRGLRWYSVKLVWSTDAPVGATCNKTRNLLTASESVILRSGPRLGEWIEEEIDPSALFRAHFADGNPDAEVPELQGIGIMTDGDQTQSTSAADYAGFFLYTHERTAAR